MRFSFINYFISLSLLALLLTNSRVQSQELVAISEGGGNNFNGTIFKYDVSNDQLDVLYKFDSTSNRSFSTLYEAKNGKLYGINHSSIFSFDLNTNEYEIKFDLDSLGYDYLIGEFIYRSETSFYGVGQRRDSSRYGSLGIFEYDLSENKVTHLFQTDSSIVAATLALAEEGVFIGTNSSNGIYGGGTLFKIDLNQQNFRILLNFSNDSTGRYPITPYVNYNSVFVHTWDGYQSPIDPNFYLSTIVGYDLLGDSMLYSFRLPRYQTGTRPYPFIEVDSVLYSLSFFNPTMFTFSLNSTIPFGFTWAPDSILGPGYITYASDSLIYGVFTYGGQNGRGGIFSYDPTDQSWNYLHDFTLEEGDLSRSKFIELSECAGIDRTIGYSGSGLGSAEANANYQWLDMNYGSSIAGENGRYFTPQDTGLFAVEIRKGGCVDTSNVIKVAIVSLEKNQLNPKISIYPNPSTGIVNIDRKGKLALDYQIFNIQGKLMKRGRLATDENQIELPQAEGLYFVSFRDESGNEKTYKIVKK